MDIGYTIIGDLNDEENGAIIVSDDKVISGTYTDEWFKIICMKESDFKSLSEKELEAAEQDEQTAIDILDEHLFEYFETQTSDTLYAPNPNEYIVLYSAGTSDATQGDDPYMWDFDLSCYSYFDDGDLIEVCSKYSEDGYKFVEREEYRGGFNYGRAFIYSIYAKNESFVVSFENEGYCEPESIEGEFGTLDEAREYIKNKNPLKGE